MTSSTVEVLVRFGETDAMGIAWGPNFYGWFDVGSHQLLRSIGFPMGRMESDHGLLLPLVESGCRFRAPVTYDDRLLVVSTVEEVGRRSLRVGHRVLKDDVLVAEGFEARVSARVAAREPELRLELVDLPASLVAALTL